MKNALLAVPLLVVGAAVTAGCTPSSSASASAPSGTASPPAAASSSAASSSAGAATQASAAPSASASAAPASPGGSSSARGSSGETTACSSSSLTGSIGEVGHGPNYEHYVGLQLRNTGSRPCTLHGFPGVSWVAGASGTQVGGGAERQCGMGCSDGTAVTLAPGALASSSLDIVGTAAFPKSRCKPVPVRGLRVYPPGEKAALFVKEPGEACSSPDVGSEQLYIGYVQSGAQPPK